MFIKHTEQQQCKPSVLHFPPPPLAPLAYSWYNKHC